MTTQEPTSFDAAVIGGGLAGLTSAALLARGGLSVVLFERSERLGGRAISQTEQGYCFNLGPHALYARAAGERVLGELGVDFRGSKPSQNGGVALYGDQAHTLPAGFVSLLTTGLLPVAGKVELARLLAGIGKIDTKPLAGVTLADWLGRNVRSARVRELLAALLRLATYADEPQRASAGAAIAQLQHAVARGVYYLDGGWQTLVDGLERAARGAGVTFRTGARVARVASGADGYEVRMHDATTAVSARAVILATPPATAAAMVDGAAQATLRQWEARSCAVRAAVLDVGLARLPQPRVTFGLGVDTPHYFSVHSAAARLAPGDGALVHAARYLGAGEDHDAKATERELEALFDRLQPGWRACVVHRRYLPNLVVSHALVGAEGGGYAARPGPEVAGADGLYVAGDWVGGEGMLADASFASARRAAELVAARAVRRRAA